ncbi:MAG TPA: lysophospholipid acyltransferase family protein [Fimbriimonadales bacterium]|nr:lysophospholipid acyltransferase family protein [Fimbriimonadales bacterium]
MAQGKNKPLKRHWYKKIAGLFIAGASRLVLRLPEGIAEGFGSSIGKLAYFFSKKYRTRAIENLRMCFPEWDENKVKRTARAVFEHFGRTAARFFRSYKMPPHEILNTIVAEEGLDALEQAKALQKGLIIVTAHFGNWERAAQYMNAKGYKINTVARDADDELTGEIVNRARREQGTEVYSRGSAAKDLLRALSRNEAVAILVDQNANDVFVPFFGFPAGTVAGPAVLHLRTGAPILIGFCLENGKGQYRVSFVRPTFPPATGNQEEDIRTIMTVINKVLEDKIREHPEQWLWMHDRWRSARKLGLLETK